MSTEVKSFEFSELDRKIIAILKKDGRTSNQKIADALGVTTSVVATRIRRMESEKAMKVVAVSDFSAFDYNVLLLIGVDVKGRRADEVAQDLAKIEDVLVVHLVTGRHDIEILVTLQRVDQAQDLLLNKISKVPGVRGLDSSIAVDILKYEFDTAPI